MFKYCILLVTLICLSPHIRAQVSDTLKEFELKDYKQPNAINEKSIFNVGSKSINIDTLTLSQYQHQSLAQLITEQFPLFVRSFGVNSAAFLHFRGSSAAHSQLYWEGIPLNSANNGLVDVSIIPSFFNNQIHFQSNGSGALYGSGNIGASIQIGNKAQYTDAQLFDFKHKLLLGIGQFGQKQLGERSAFSTKQWHVNTNVFYTQAHNDFPYNNYFGEDKKMINAQMAQWHVKTSLSHLSKTGHEWQVHYWLSHNYREIPPALFENFSTKILTLNTHRVVLKHEKTIGAHRFYNRLSFLTEDNQYQDSLIRLQQHYVTQQWYAESGWQTKVNDKWLHHVFVPLQFQRLEDLIVSANDIKKQTRIGLAYATYYPITSKWSLSLQGRVDHWNHQWRPVFGLQSGWRLGPYWLHRFNVQRTYRIPNLTELFVFPGGNEQLQPEYGWHLETGIERKWPLGNQQWTASADVYYRNIQNWIMWYGGSIWTPHNAAQAQSIGFELKLGYSKQWSPHLYSRWNIQYEHCEAKMLQSKLGQNIATKYQLPNIPLHTGRLQLDILYKKWNWTLNGLFTGMRYVTSDESMSIPPYTVWNAKMTKALQFNNTELTLGLQINNLSNKNYEVVFGRPMMGRHFMLTLQLDL